jgi:hypothetical protein
LSECFRDVIAELESVRGVSNDHIERWRLTVFDVSENVRSDNGDLFIEPEFHGHAS